MNLEDTQSQNKLEVTDFIKSTLLETAKWAKLLAIIGFVGIGLMVVLGFFMGTITSMISSIDPYAMEDNPFDAIGGIFVSIIYFVMALLYYFPIKYLFDFATKVKKAIAITDQQLFTEALVNLKAHYRYIGILMIVLLAFYALMLIVMIIGLIAAASM
nr:hypothetical protein [uncultured Flavobacterium sp.]